MPTDICPPDAGGRHYNPLCYTSRASVSLSQFVVTPRSRTYRPRRSRPARLVSEPLEISGPGEALHDFRRAAAQRLDRERRRLAAARAREHARVRHVQVAPAVAA